MSNSDAFVRLYSSKDLNKLAEPASLLKKLVTFFSYLTQGVGNLQFSLFFSFIHKVLKFARIYYSIFYHTFAYKCL